MKPARARGSPPGAPAQLRALPRGPRPPAGEAGWAGGRSRRAGGRVRACPAAAVLVQPRRPRAPLRRGRGRARPPARIPRPRPTFLRAVGLRGGGHGVARAGERAHERQHAGPVIPGPAGGRRAGVRGASGAPAFSRSPGGHSPVLGIAVSEAFGEGITGDLELRDLREAGTGLALGAAGLTRSRGAPATLPSAPPPFPFSTRKAGAHPLPPPQGAAPLRGWGALLLAEELPLFSTHKCPPGWASDAVRSTPHPLRSGVEGPPGIWVDRASGPQWELPEWFGKQTFRPQ